jgi:DNA-binding transcriptional MerR regulator
MRSRLLSVRGVLRFPDLILTFTSTDVRIAQSRRLIVSRSEDQDSASQALRGPESAGAFSIRHLGREFSVSARTLRFYEEKGLISPQRRGQDRIYSRRDRARLKYVLMGKSVGFSLEEIREMLDLYDLGDRQETQLRVAHGKFGERIARLERQRDEIANALAELAHARKMIEGMLASRAKKVAGKT